MMRSSVSAQLFACSVAMHKWPVPASAKAASMVSRSRISPTKMTSGADLTALRKARAKDLVSRPTSRWLMIDFLLVCRNSIGSSIVKIWSDEVSLRKLIIAASVVDFPAPAAPTIKMSPRLSITSSLSTSGMPRSSSLGISAVM